MELADPVNELWVSYDSEKSMEIRNKIFQYYSPWIKKISSYQYSKYATDYVDWSDCVQNASIALLESIDKYEFSRGVPFEAFAYARIKGAILNGLNDLGKNRFRISTDLEDLITEVEISDNFDEAFDQLLDVVIDMAFSKLLDLSSHRVSQVGMDPLESYIINSEEEKVISAVKVLSAELQFVIISHYNHFLTFTQIADHLKISKSRVSQIHRDALKRLRVIYENF